MWTTGFQKGPHRRCFKVSSGRRLAVEPTGGVSSGYLTVSLTRRGIGGHPQARATLGRGDLVIPDVIINGVFCVDRTAPHLAGSWTGRTPSPLPDVSICQE